MHQRHSNALRHPLGRDKVPWLHTARIDRGELARESARSRIDAIKSRSTFATFALQCPLERESLECAQQCHGDDMVRWLHTARIDPTELARDFARSCQAATESCSALATFAVQRPLERESLECAQQSHWRRHGAVAAHGANRSHEISA